MIQHQFSIPSKIDINKLLRDNITFPNLAADKAENKLQRYINDHQDKYAYFISKIVETRVFNRSIKNDDYVCLNWEKLRDFLGKRYADEVRANLLQWNIIQCDNHFIRGTKSFGYRIHPSYVSKSILRDIFKVEVMGKKLDAQHKEYVKKYTRNTTYSNLKKLCIDVDKAITYVDTKLDTTISFLYDNIDVLSTTTVEDKMYSKVCKDISLLSHPTYSLTLVHLLKSKLQRNDNKGLTAFDILIESAYNQYDTDVMSISKIKNKQFFLEQPDTESRIYTNLTSLSTDLRQFLYHHSSTEKLVNLDIRNSQPFIFAAILKDYYKASTVLPEDVQEYINLCAVGTIYEEIMNRLQVEETQRRTFKIKFFANLFFCKNQHSENSKAGKLFMQDFPNVYRVIHENKAVNYKYLAILMQRKEASIILKTISKKLQKQGIYHNTIHDSVIVLESDVETVKNLMLEAFTDAIGVAPSIKAEVLAEEKFEASIAPIEMGLLSINYNDFDDILSIYLLSDEYCYEELLLAS
ncbi:hypothetical protein MUN82_10280 [Hymenobacter aerilatus]|uniref:Uncharacterized protein n=1 Tax=Hymenobacter aerilatus TaxID=2932251 RepID=A0A8T9T2R4_9BACT|nr:hypothetical protein [Hymenobacter aerilatus]UOR07464.1 hypothetical protein MUN82_10280 [Hymenobacter aerilatus]